jgi:hypothetical protein
VGGPVIQVFAVCPDGYAVYECTCPIQHRNIRVTKCPPNHDHVNNTHVEIPGETSV